MNKISTNKKKSKFKKMENKLRNAYLLLSANNT